MSGKRARINRQRLQDEEDRERGTRQLARLRAAIVNKSHWVLATDRPVTSLALRGLVHLLLRQGAPRERLLAFDTHVVAVNTADRIELSVVALSKSLLTREQIVPFVAGVCRPDPIPTVRSETDIFTISAGPDRVAGCLDAIHRGRAFFSDPNTN